MNTTSQAVAALNNTLAIEAFDTFRDAALAADLPLPAINAFASYKCACDFALQAAEAALSGDTAEAERLTRWSRAKLDDMRAELAALPASVRT